MDPNLGPGQSNQPIDPLTSAVSITGLATLAVVQPILDVVARGPEFLVAHRLDGPGIVVMVSGLLAVAVLAGSCAGLLVKTLPPRGRMPAMATMVGLFLGVIALQVGIRLSNAPDFAVVAAAATTGTAGALLYRASGSFRLMGRYLGAAPLVVTAWFLIGLPPSLTAEADLDAAIRAHVPAPVPVVIVIFDEFPLASLIDDEGNLLAAQYPSFARLVSDGVWYRNALTVQTRTTEAIPAILSGSLVPDGLLPNPVDHPHTLLTVLAESHDVATLEPVTNLCPVAVCRPASHSPEGSLWKWKRLGRDLAVILGHLSLPPVMADHLPSMNHAWAGFEAPPAATTADDPTDFDLMARVTASVEGDRRGDVASFLEMLEPPPDGPSLRVGHFMLPHRPWDYLPDGSLHRDGSMSGHDGRGWGADPYLVATGWRRHLLQVGYADTILGAIIDRLVDRGVYQSTLLVVVADHGVTFAPGVADMRVTSADTIGSILPIPLLIKYPEGGTGVPPPGTISDVRAETIDVVPTVLDVLGVEPPRPLDGASLLGPEPAERTDTRLTIRGEVLVMSREGSEKLAVAADKLAWFPEGDPFSLVPTPEARHLLGQPTESVDQWGQDVYAVSLAPGDNRGAVVAGTVTRTPPPLGDELVALAVDGVIAAVTRVGTPTGDQAPFSFLVDPDLLTGEATLDTFVVSPITP